MRFRLLYTIAAVTALAACRDGAEPTAASGAESPRAIPSRLLYAVGDTAVLTFDYDPATGGIFELGESASRVIFPAYSVCDPATSRYGPAHWDAGCRTARRPITIVVRMFRDAEGRAHADFSPNLRFVPSEPVELHLSDADAADPMYAGLLTIEYCLTPTRCEDESLTDPSLATHVSPETGTVWRRIKHFSGYNVAAGYSSGPTQEIQ